MDHRKVVLSVATEWASSRGGLSTLNRKLCIALARCGYDVFCYVEKPTPKEVREALDHEVKLIQAARLEAGPVSQELMLPASLPKGVVPEIVIGHGRVTGQAAKVQADIHFPGAQRIHFIHVIPEEISPHTHPGSGAEAARERDLQERNAAKGADLVVGVGPAIHREMGNLLSAFERKPKTYRFDPPMNPPAGSRDLPDGLHVLLMGRLEDVQLKGGDIAVRAVSRAAESLSPNPVLVVRGSPPGTDAKLLKQLSQLDEAVNHRFTIRVRSFTTDEEELREDLRRASLLVMPSRAEGFGLVGLEAFEQGTPLLVSRRSGLAEVIQEKLGTSGEKFVVGVSDADIDSTVEAWATRIYKVLSNREEAFSEVARCAQILAEGSSWETAAANLIATLPEKSSTLHRSEIPAQSTGRATDSEDNDFGGTASESLASAVRHPNKDNVRSLLNALTKRHYDDDDSARVQVYAFRTLAILEEHPDQRLATRRRGISLARKNWERFRSVASAIAWADIAVDCFYDAYASEEPDRRDVLLREAKNAVDEALKLATDSHAKAALLSQKSSILGCQALVAPKRDRDARLKERLGCAKKAADLSETNPMALIALANSEWMAARWTNDYSRRVAHYNTAELSFRRAAKGDPISRLVLSRFWRLTHRPIRALDTFLIYVELEHDLWRRRAESHLFGETIMLLSSQGFSQDLVRAAALKARMFLQDTIAAGVASARTYLAMANVLQILDLGQDAGMVLGRLRRAKQGDWTEVISEAMRALERGKSLELDSAFVLGLAEPSTWNQLGIYAKRWTKDAGFARACWETGLRLKDNDPELLTNLARTLAISDEPNDLVIATDYIDRAAFLADQTWRWWRPVRTQVNEGRRRVGMTPLPALDRANYGWAAAEKALDELRESKIDAEAMLKKLCALSNGVLLSDGLIETADFTLSVTPEANRVTLRGPNDASFELGHEQFAEIVNGRIGLAALLERSVVTLFPESLRLDPFNVRSLVSSA